MVVKRCTIICTCGSLRRFSASAWSELKSPCETGAVARMLHGELTFAAAEQFIPCVVAGALVTYAIVQFAVDCSDPAGAVDGDVQPGRVRITPAAFTPDLSRRRVLSAGRLIRTDPAAKYATIAVVDGNDRSLASANFSRRRSCTGLLSVVMAENKRGKISSERSRTLRLRRSGAAALPTLARARDSLIAGRASRRGWYSTI